MLDARALTIFPGIFESFLSYGNPARAIEAGLLTFRTIDIRDFTDDVHRSTDDYPYGGGTGMIMKPEPVVRAIRWTRSIMTNPRVVLMTPHGRVFRQPDAEAFAQLTELVFVCGRYEGMDERVREYVDEELSVGDFVLSGGETAVMAVTDAVSRLIPGVIGADSHIDGESFYNGLLEYPQYTRPRSFEGFAVPGVLLEGHHEKIRVWRKKQALIRTLERRPDLMEGRQFTEEEQKLLDEIQADKAHGA